MKSKDFSVSKEDFSIVRCSECNFHFTNPRPRDEELVNTIFQIIIYLTTIQKNIFEKHINL